MLVREERAEKPNIFYFLAGYVIDVPEVISNSLRLLFSYF